MVIFCKKNWIFVDAGLLKHNRTLFIGSFDRNRESIHLNLWIEVFGSEPSLVAIQSESLDQNISIGSYVLEPLDWIL